MIARLGFIALWSLLMLLAYGAVRLLEWLIGLVGLFHVWVIGWILEVGFTIAFWGLAIAWLLGIAFIALREARTDAV